MAVLHVVQCVKCERSIDSNQQTVYSTHQHHQLMGLNATLRPRPKRLQEREDKKEENYLKNK